MKTSVYITSEEIQVLCYNGKGHKVQVTQFLTCPLHEGAIINGKILDRGAVVDGLKTLRSGSPKLFAHTSLIVDGSSILSKRSAVPKMSHKQYLQFVRDEFLENIENPEELVCEYMKLDEEKSNKGAKNKSKNKGKDPDENKDEANSDGKKGGKEKKGSPSMTILACATDKDQAESYQSVFTEAGIRLRSIHIGVQSVVDYVRARPPLQESLFVINIIDGVTMLSMMFDHGVNVFISRTRLYGEDREQIVANILESLSGLIQFSRSEQRGDVTESYYLGLGDQDLQLMALTNPYPGVRLGGLDVRNPGDTLVEIPPSAHFIYLNTALGGASVDLIRGLRSLEAWVKSRRPKKTFIPITVGAALAVIGLSVWLYMDMRGLRESVASLEEYVNDPGRIARSEEIDRISTETSRYQYKVDQIVGKTLYDFGKTSITIEIMDLIMLTNNDTVTINRFDFDEAKRIVSVSGLSGTENDSSAYVETLKRSSLVSAVYYTGYSYGNEGYNFSIEIELSQWGITES